MSWKCIQLTVYPGDDLKVYSKMSWKCIQLTVYPGDDLKVYSKEDLKVYSWDAAEDSSALYQITSDKWRRGYGRENTTYVHTFLLGALFTRLNVSVAYQKWQKSGKGMRRRLVFPKIEQFRPFPGSVWEVVDFLKADQHQVANSQLQTKTKPRNSSISPTVGGCELGRLRSSIHAKSGRLRRYISAIFFGFSSKF